MQSMIMEPRAMETGIDPPSGQGTAGRILIVDDDEKSRRLLTDLLEVQGYETFQACNGREALEKAPQVEPDVILLDVMMPDVDGIRVCEQLRADPVFAPTQVLMITALRDREHRVAGIQAGANDFLSKPVDTQELQLRVRNAVWCKRLYDEAQRSYRALRELEALRDQWVHMFAHDLRSPLMVVDMGLDLLAMGDAPEDDIPVVEQIPTLKAEVARVADMVNSMLDASKLETTDLPLQPAEIDLSALAGAVVQRLKPLFTQRQVDVHTEPDSVTATLDSQLIERVLVNLLLNAVKYTSPDGRIRLSIRDAAEEVRVEIQDDGTGIAASAQSNLFKKFAPVDAIRRKSSTGLGLFFCKMAVEAHGGCIGAESALGEGSLFWFTLPRNQATAG